MQMPTMAVCHAFQMPRSSPGSIWPGQALASSLGQDQGQTGAHRVALGPARTAIFWCPWIPGKTNTPALGRRLRMITTLVDTKHEQNPCVCFKSVLQQARTNRVELSPSPPLQVN